MENQTLLTPGELLGKDGNLIEAGYATSLVRRYDRKAIRAGKSRIKEWDYYFIGDEHAGIALTVADNSYMSLASASLVDYHSFAWLTTSKIRFFSNGKLHMPASSAIGDVVYDKGKTDIRFLNDGVTRRLAGSFPKFFKKEKLVFDISLKGGGESMVIATPFAKKGHFYYNQKINCMPARGFYEVGGRRHEFKENAFGVLDWGRGVWTYKNTWYWSSLSASVGGHAFGFNLGYGFGDTSAASENMLFYDGKAHKLGKVEFFIPMNTYGGEEYLKPWEIRDLDGRLSLKFYPRFDRKDYTKFLMLQSDQHQVFGSFHGKAVLDDGTEIALSGEIGFAEKVFNKW